MQNEERDSLRDNFRVLVSATMSAGKSTVINFLLGKELLPTANQATTARLFRIADHQKSDFEVLLKTNGNSSNWVTASTEYISLLNSEQEQGLIELRGNIKAARNLDVQLVIYDTPGPNNSLNKNHKEIALKALKDGQYEMIVYVLNFGQLGTDDDADMLRELGQILEREENFEKHTIFVLNKVDLVDEDRDGSVGDIVQRTKIYLEKNGFKNPIVLPMSAHAAFLAQKCLSGQVLTRDEKRKLGLYIEQFSESKGCFLNAGIQAAEDVLAIRWEWRKNEKKGSIQKLFLLLSKYLFLKEKTDVIGGFRKSDLNKVVYESGCFSLEFYIRKASKIKADTK